MELDISEKRKSIHKKMVFLAFRIFNHHGKPNFAKAYDKLVARVLLDWNINLNRIDRIKGENMFDVLDGDELDKVYQSSINLWNMYKGVFEKVAGL